MHVSRAALNQHVVWHNPGFTVCMQPYHSSQGTNCAGASQATDPKPVTALTAAPQSSTTSSTASSILNCRSRLVPEHHGTLVSRTRPSACGRACSTPEQAQTTDNRQLVGHKFTVHERRWPPLLTTASVAPKMALKISDVAHGCSAVVSGDTVCMRANGP
jgi:hypothetical protein